jgi:nucleotide-binding universal stress UspA family protein
MKILAAICDSDYGKAVIEFIAAHNWPDGSEFKLVSVIEPVEKQRGNTDEDRRAVFDAEKTSSEKLLSQMKIDLLEKRPQACVTNEVLVGSASREIVKCAEACQPAMIVMGSHGRRGLERLLLGSVSFYVASHAACAVSIIRLDHEDKPGFELNKEDIEDGLKSFERLQF